MNASEKVISDLKKTIQNMAEQYHIKRVELFGSRAAGTNKGDSDIDLLVEFNVPITLLTLAGLKIDLEEKSKLNVDVIHGPLPEDSILKIGEKISIYGA